MGALAVTAIGPDRPGIVAALAGVLVAHGSAITDSHMAVLGGRFSAVLVVESPEEGDLALLREDLDRIADDVGLDAVALDELTDVDDHAVPDPTHVLTVSGVDDPAVVHAVATALARAGASITDLSTRRLEEEGEASLVAMLVELVAPGIGDDALAQALDDPAREHDLDVVLRRLAGDEDDDR